ncbi:hypothetical protein LKE01_23470 [Lentilactobacillus kefiri]|uniref:Uncharacterized protein n=1 Tax=Lentilactobacillus kefiri TaxID=33962 RepID=A0A511DZ70_LENKE|nr:hypothetical protein LKE01_23470 [Lentilactobacillus kefiri]
MYLVATPLEFWLGYKPVHQGLVEWAYAHNVVCAVDNVVGNQ